MPTKVYDRTIGELKSAVVNGKLGREEQLQALKRLDNQARRLERQATGPSVEALISEEKRESRRLGGRTVFGWEPASRDGDIGEADAVDAALSEGRHGCTA